MISFEEEQKYLLQTAWRRARQTRVTLARVDPIAFNNYVLQDEKTAQEIKCCRMHEEWHQILERTKRIVIWSHYESGKTNQLTIGRVLHEIGKNPTLRVVIANRTKTGARKLLGAVKQYIEQSPRLHEVFPNLKQNSRGLAWNNDAIIVERKTLSKDPTVQAVGIGGQILGARIDLLVLDDLLDQENTETQEQREKTIKWVTSTLFTRLVRGASAWCLGNVWHEKDLMHKLVEEHEFMGVKYPIRDEKGVIYWQERWDEERIKQARIDLGPLEFTRKMECKTISPDTARFRPEWFVESFINARNYSVVKRLDMIPNGFAVFHGVDVSTGEGNDLTAIVSVLVHPDGARQVLNVESAKLTGPEIVMKLDEIYDRYGGIFIVENNAAQQFIIQFARMITMAAIIPFTTGKNKADPSFGLESIAVEIEQKRWIFPNRTPTKSDLFKSADATSRMRLCKLDPEVDALVREMLSYKPTEHTGDRLMAMFFAREGCRNYDKHRRRDVTNESPEELRGMRVITG